MTLTQAQKDELTKDGSFYSAVVVVVDLMDGRIRSLEERIRQFEARVNQLEAREPAKPSLRVVNDGP